MVKLRFSFEVEFDSQQTALAYGVALGSMLPNVDKNAKMISAAPKATVERGQVECVDGAAAPRHA